MYFRVWMTRVIFAHHGKDNRQREYADRKIYRQARHTHHNMGSVPSITPLIEGYR